MIRGMLALIGSTLLYASVAGGAAPMLIGREGPHDGTTVGGVPLVGPISEPVGLLLLGTGFVLVACQVRRKR